MSNTHNTLKRLGALADMAFNAELAKLSAIQAEATEPEARIKALETARAERGQHMTQATGFDEATLFGADQKWGAWAEKKRAAALADLAKIAARQEEQLVKTRRAFGKKEALRQVAERLNRQPKS